MATITYDQKIELLNRYKERPMAVQDPDIITAIIQDVLKTGPKRTRTIPVDGAESDPNVLYNQCMGVYRAFLKSRDSHLDMTGVKAKRNSEAMRHIIAYVRSFTRANGRPYDDEHVFMGVKFMFDHWHRLNDFHRSRLSLTDIHAKIEEILPMIKNGHDKRTNDNNALDELEHRLKKQ